jgi:hypothetical protein
MTRRKWKESRVGHARYVSSSRHHNAASCSDAASYPAENDSTRLLTRLLRLISCMLVVGIYMPGIRLRARTS